MLALLRIAGLSDDLAVSGSYLLTVVVNGFMLEEAPASGRQPDAEFLRAVSGYFASLPEDRFTNLVAVADAYTQGDADERFESLIDLFVDGLIAPCSGLTHGRTMRSTDLAPRLLQRVLTRRQAIAAAVPTPSVQATATAVAASGMGSPPARLQPIWVMP